MQSHVQKHIIDRISATKIYEGWAVYGNLNGLNNSPDKASKVWKICLIEKTGTVEEIKRPEDSKGRASDSFSFSRDDRTSLSFI